MKSSTFVFGIIEAILFFILGVIVLIYPTMATTFIIYLAGALLLIDGIIAAVRIFRVDIEGVHRARFIIEALFGIIFGFMLIFGSTTAAALILVYVLIFWFLITAVIHLATAIQLRGGLRIVSVILNAIIIGISIWSFFNVGLAFSIFIWTVALMFMALAVEKIVLLIAGKEIEKELE